MSNVAKEAETEVEADQNVSSQEKMSSVTKTERAKSKLHDDDTLFSQPEGNHLGECPICFLPLPLDTRKSVLKSCCSSVICKGCIYANFKSNIHDKEKAIRCPFCREPQDDEQDEKRLEENEGK